MGVDLYTGSTYTPENTVSTVDTVHVNVANDCQKQSVSKGDSDTETFTGVCHCIYPFSKES